MFDIQLMAKTNFRPFSNLALIGIGLIGSSIALAARRMSLANKLTIATRSETTLREARKLKLGDEYHLDFAAAVADADCVILSIPIGAYGEVSKVIAPHLRNGAILTDVGSVKRGVIAQVKPHLNAKAHFIPGHPIAGTEESGPGAGFASLFKDRWCILTPDDDADPVAIARMKNFWRAMGSEVAIMEADHHDLVLAITSHLPHLIAYSIVDTAINLENINKSEIIKYSASGFRDFTRIAASDPTMWRDIFLNNGDAVIEVLDHFISDLDKLKQAINDGDGAVLFNLFSHTRNIRRDVIAAKQETAAPDFGRRLLRKLMRN